MFCHGSSPSLCCFRGFGEYHISATYLMSLATLGQYNVPLARCNILSRPRWALWSLLLMEGLRAMATTTASPFTRIPCTTLKQACTSKYGNVHTGASRLSAGHPSNTNFITVCRQASRDVASRISSSRLSGMSPNTLTCMIRARYSWSFPL